MPKETRKPRKLYRIDLLHLAHDIFNQGDDKEGKEEEHEAD